MGCIEDMLLIFEGSSDEADLSDRVFKRLAKLAISTKDDHMILTLQQTGLTLPDLINFLTKKYFAGEKIRAHRTIVLKNRSYTYEWDGDPDLDYCLGLKTLPVEADFTVKSKWAVIPLPANAEVAKKDSDPKQLGNLIKAFRSWNMGSFDFEAIRRFMEANYPSMRHYGVKNKTEQFYEGFVAGYAKGNAPDEILDPYREFAVAIELKLNPSNPREMQGQLRHYSGWKWQRSAYP